MKKAWLNNAIEINTADTSVASSGNYLIGLDGFDVWPMNGPIAAVLAYDAVHNDTTRQAIQTILADKFGITLA